MSSPQSRLAMEKILKAPIFFLLLILALSSCAPQADFDIRGEWEYTMTASDGNTYDAGTMTFSGEPAKGTYLQVNIYEVEYEGDFTLNGSALKLTGYETWEGFLTDANTMEGTWSRDGGVDGIFVARRR
jgi:hypothetical protein